MHPVGAGAGGAELLHGKALHGISDVGDGPACSSQPPLSAALDDTLRTHSPKLHSTEGTYYSNELGFCFTLAAVDRV